MVCTYLIPHQFFPWHKLCLIAERLLAQPDALFIAVELGPGRLSGVSSPGQRCSAASQATSAN